MGPLAVAAEPSAGRENPRPQQSPAAAVCSVLCALTPSARPGDSTRLLRIAAAGRTKRERIRNPRTHREEH